MIQDPSKNLTLIVYNSPKPPKYIKVSKGLIKSLFVLIPTLVIFSISISFLYSIVLKNKIVKLKSKTPKEILRLTSLNSDLSAQLETITADNKVLTEKLSKGTGSETSLSAMGLFTTPIGLEDFRAKNLLDIDDIQLTVDKTIKLKFNLSNNSDEKLQGYISVIQYQSNLIQFYPNYELSQKNLRLEYTQGEIFGFSRLRPTVAEFKKLSSASARYKIFIFSKTGNLMAYKQVGPYNVTQ